jgi:hypothetical protein
MSKRGQERFQEFLFPTKPQSDWQRRALGALVAFAHRTDRWLADRAPTT